ncbi:MAG: FtsX-like permease family protein [Pseudomonadota bacterium]
MLAQLFHCAFEDLKHDRLASLCQILVIVAIVIPLALALGLLNGFVGRIMHDLVSDPYVLQLRPTRTVSLHQDALRSLRQLPEVGFVVPNTRPIAGQMLLARDRAGEAHPRWEDVGLWPSADGDPLAPDRLSLAPKPDRLSVSANVAKALDVAPGDALRALITRARDGVEEEIERRFVLEKIVPNHLEQHPVAFVHLEFLAAVERYKDHDFSVPLFGVDGAKPWRDISRYAALRLYATDIHRVAPLADKAKSLLNVEFRTEAARINSALRLRGQLRLVFSLLVGVAVVGLVGALLASMAANVERKRRSLAVLALLGFPPRWLAGFPVVQALMIAVAALIVVAVGVFSGAAILESTFAGVGTQLVVLRAADWVICVGLVIILACIPAYVAGRNASKIEPSEALREI